MHIVGESAVYFDFSTDMQKAGNRVRLVRHQIPLVDDAPTARNLRIEPVRPVEPARPRPFEGPDSQPFVARRQFRRRLVRQSGAGTGFRGDCVVADDPINKLLPTEALGSAATYSDCSKTP